MTNKYNLKNLCIISKNRENREEGEKNGLTESQIEMLQDVCSARHQIHSGGGAHLFNGESGGNFKKYWNFFNFLNKFLSEELKTPVISDYNYIEDQDYWEDCPTDSDYNYIWEEEDKKEKSYDDFVEESLIEIRKKIEKLNDRVEKTLKKIDEEFNTSYCPTGYSRLQF